MRIADAGETAVLGPIRRLLGGSAVVVLASAAFVATTPAPAPAAETIGYTIEVQIPRGINPSSRCRLATVDLTTGVVTGIGGFDSDPLRCAPDLAFSPSGGLYGIARLPGEVETPSVEDTTPTTDAAPVEPQQITDTVHLVQFDTTSGALSDLGQIGTVPAAVAPAGGITFDASGNLYVYMVGDDTQCNGGAYCLYRVDPANPADATFLGDEPQQTYLFGLTASCALGPFTVEDASEDTSADVLPADDVYGFASGNQLDLVSTTPPASATAVGGLVQKDQTVQSLDFDSDGTLWALGSLVPNGLPVTPGRLSTLDPATGAQTVGPSLSSEAETVVMALAVAAPTCPTEPVELQPTFTG